MANSVDPDETTHNDLHCLFSVCMCVRGGGGGGGDGGGGCGRGQRFFEAVCSLCIQMN